MSNNRLYFIDALKGLSIILVVYYHIFAYVLSCTSVLNEFFISWRMPLFFFVSGYFSFEPHYDASLTKKRIHNRIFKQLHPTVLICLFYVLAVFFVRQEAPLKEYLLHAVYDPSKTGYWFTFSLVQVFLFSCIIQYGFHRFKAATNTQRVALSLLFFITAMLSAVSTISFDNSPAPVRVFWNISSLGKTTELLSFFILGSLFKSFGSKTFSFISRIPILTLGIALIALSHYLPEYYMVYFCGRLGALIFIIGVCYRLQSTLSPKNIIGRYLIRIGSQTLPIYLFHFFILLLVGMAIPYPESVKELIANPIVEFVSLSIISILITELCLIADHLIKKSPKCHKLIFNPTIRWNIQP